MKIFYWISLSLICMSTSKVLIANENNHTIHTDEKYKLNNQKTNILRAINYLDQACILSRSIEDQEIKNSIFNHLIACSRCLRKEFLSKNYENVTETSRILYENIGEILTDCQDIELRDNIMSYVIDMMNVLENKNINSSMISEK